MQTVGGTLDKVWLLAWYIDKKNTMELLMKKGVTVGCLSKK
jgi:hypothetical protein